MGKRNKHKQHFSTKKHFSSNTIPSSVDLHTHTVRSLDGGLSVARVLKHALSNNIQYLSITDHNNLDGAKKALRFIAQNPEKYPKLNIIPGVEITCLDKELGAGFHLLAYDFDINNQALNDKLKEIRRQERQNYYALFTILERNFNIVFSPYEIVKASATHSNITWDVIGEMAVCHFDENGKPAPYATSPSQFISTMKSAIEANKNFVNIQDKLMLNINNMGFHNIERTKYPSLDEILPIIKAAGGVPVLAHPKNISFVQNSELMTSSNKNYNKKVEQFIQNFKNKTALLKMDAGMEVFFAAQSKKEDYYFGLAQKNSLLISGGSDFHGPHKSLNHRIGTVANRYHITKLPLVNYLTNGRKKEYITNVTKATDYIYKIDNKTKETYSNKNVSILENNRLRKASQLNLVLQQFGNKPMPINFIFDRTIQMKRRNNLLECEKLFNELLQNDRIVLKEAVQTKQKCLKNIVYLHKNYSEYQSLLHNYKDVIEKVEKYDKLENKEKFIAYANKTLNTLEHQYEIAMESRVKMFSLFLINPKAAYKSAVNENKLKNITLEINQPVEINL